MPPAAGRLNAVPTSAASMARLPPTSTPVPTPPTIVVTTWPASRSTTDSGSITCRRSSSALASVADPSDVTTCPWIVTRPSRDAIAWCKAVMSEKPTSSRGSASARRRQSSRSSNRCAPYPPRAAQTADTVGSSQASVRSAARSSSLPAR